MRDRKGRGSVRIEPHLRPDCRGEKGAVSFTLFCLKRGGAGGKEPLEQELKYGSRDVLLRRCALSPGDMVLGTGGSRRLL